MHTIITNFDKDDLDDCLECLRESDAYEQRVGACVVKIIAAFSTEDVLIVPNSDSEKCYAIVYFYLGENDSVMRKNLTDRQRFQKLTIGELEIHGYRYDSGLFDTPEDILEHVEIIKYVTA